ncbi:MAG: GNAT family N-acetyltransferase [Ruminiclostridium sp.]|nr:GNAT family N-acetyltransferase [Ruminiclostridium sp.]
MRELASGEVYMLEECLRELAEHHNSVSVYFRGQYPKKPFGDTLASFEKDIAGGRSRICVIENDGRISGFCKTDITGASGAIDYLIVLRECRGSGYGNMLMEWAMDVFAQSGVRTIEVKVADGNNAIDFYEKYGFKPNAHILRMDIK